MPENALPPYQELEEGQCTQPCPVHRELAPSPEYANPSSNEHCPPSCKCEDPDESRRQISAQTVEHVPEPADTPQQNHSRIRKTFDPAVTVMRRAFERMSSFWKRDRSCTSEGYLNLGIFIGSVACLASAGTIAILKML